MSYHPLSAYNCHRLSTIIPTSIFRLPTIAGFALASSQPINPSPSSVLLISEDIEQVEPHPAMQQILSDHQNMHPASYPTAYRDLTSKTEPPSASAMVLPFPAVDYFVYLAWDVINGKTNSALQSALQLTIHPPTPPPQAPTLHPDSAFREYIQRLITTTAVSQSVVVVALFYLYKARAHLQRLLLMGDTVDQPMAYGMCAASLMLGNKFLDDNTYTSRTWATLSGYTLWDINDCERKLLQALDFQLNITLQEYNDWWRFLSMYTPSEMSSCGYVTTNNVSTSRPLSAESWAPIMPVNRRIARIETSSRPASRKRSRADDEVDMPNKRSAISTQTRQTQAPKSQAAVYQPMLGPPSANQVFIPTMQEHLPLQAYPFAFGNGGIMQNLPLGYYKLVASPVDPRANDHHRKAQLVDPSQQPMYMPQLQYPSAQYAPIMYSDSARRLSAPSLDHSAPLPVINRSTYSNGFDDHFSLGDSQSACSRKVPCIGLSTVDHQAYGQQHFSLYPETTVNLGQFDNVYPHHVE